jgi:O-antigen ligase
MSTAPQRAKGVAGTLAPPGRYLSCLLYLLPVSLLLGTNLPLTEIGGRTLYIGSNEILIVLLVVGMLGKQPLRRAKTSASSGVLWSVLLFSAVLPVSIVAFALKAGGAPSISSFIETVRWFEYLSILFIVAALVRTRTQVSRILVILSACFFVLIAVSIYQAALFEYVGARAYGLFVSASDRQGGSESNPNVLGAALMGSGLFFLAFASSNRTKGRKWFYLALVLSFVALALTLSRSAVVGFLIGAVTILLYQGVSKFRMLGGVALSLMALMGTVFFSESVRDRLLNSFSLQTQTTEALSTLSRLEGAQATLEGLPKNLWFGVGYGGFEKAFGFLTPDDYYLEILATTGVIGLGLTLLMFWRIFARVREAMIAGDPQFLVLRSAYLGTLVAFLIANLFSGLLFNPRLAGLFWLMTGLIFQLTRFEEARVGIRKKRGWLGTVLWPRMVPRTQPLSSRTDK